ncbi:unnamed protein product [Schistosoma margrebowiei]|uniref:Uncharacterized protein n=1 Tax=Schistosoma margrebowiei TaxID=48269 RepID=A0A183N6Z9_9TREM|nr:unnamed protein product [Schistosoma margrebowiei]
MLSIYHVILYKHIKKLCNVVIYVLMQNYLIGNQEIGVNVVDGEVVFSHWSG